MSENTGFLGSVVAKWLQKCVAKMLPEGFEYVYFECRRGICGIYYVDFEATIGCEKEL